MLRILSCMLLYLAVSKGQVPYGSTPGPFTPIVPSAITPTIPPTIPPVGPTGVPNVPFAPFGPSPRPFLPNGYNNNPYYNPVAGPVVPILTYSSEHVGDGSYSFSYSTADGKQAQESGYLKDAYIDNAGEPQGTQVVQGSYAYIAPDGTPIQVSYVADENGFRPSGVHIPADGKGLPPPLPLVDGRKDNRIIDPLNRINPYNRYDPYHQNPYHQNPYHQNPYRQNPYHQIPHHHNHYNNHFNGNFNRPPYDARYPYDPTRLNPHNPFNPYRPGPGPVPPYGKDINGKDAPKKD